MLLARPSGRNILKFLVLVITLIVIAAILHFKFGYRLHVDGSGWRPRFVSQNREAHYVILDKNRGQQKLRNTESEISPRTGSSLALLPKKILPTEINAHRNVSENIDTAKNRTQNYWTDFRGPKRDGRYEAAPILTTWPESGLPLLWHQPIGGGYASFIAADGRLFTIEQRRQQEMLVSYDLETGHEYWNNGWDANFREVLGGDGPRATPTWDEGRIYSLGATGELRCVDATIGNLLWRRNILSENGATNLTWAMSASPLVVDNKVIVLPGGPGGRSVVAYDKITGEKIWSVLDDKQAYVSPMLVTLANQRQILVVSAERAMGLTVDEGALLWEYPWTTSQGINTAQPVLLGKNRIFLSSGYGHGAETFEVLRKGNSFSTQTLWDNIRMKNKFTSSILHEGYLYGLDESILACISAETGELMWKGGRYGYGQVMFGSGHLIVLTERGDVVLIKATPEKHQELARFAAIDGKSWNHPIIVDGRLIVRNTTEMAAFDISEENQ